MIERRLVALEQRLAAAEARLEIYDLEAEYARAWDAGDSKAWAALFVSDGVFQMAGVGLQPERICTGTLELETFCVEVSAFYRGLHFIHLPRVRIAEDRAFARVHFQWLGLIRPDARHNGHREAAGYYDVAYRRVDGRWRMTHRLEKALSGTTVETFDVYLDPDFGDIPAA